MLATANLQKRIQVHEAETQAARLRISESRRSLRNAIRYRISSPLALVSGFSAGWAAGRSPHCRGKRPFYRTLPIKTALPMVLGSLPLGLGSLVSALLFWNI